MDSWDDDEFEVPSLNEPKAPAAVTWEDEEEEDEKEEVSEKQDENMPVDPSKLRPKQLKKLKMKELEEARRLNQAVARMKAEEQANETPAERKAREQAAIEEADYENMLDAFAGENSSTPAADTASAAPPIQSRSANFEESFENLKLNTLVEHEKYGEIVANKIATSNSKHALEFLKVVLTKGCSNLSADHVKELNTVINVIKNDKIQAAKPKGKKKKQTGKQGYAKVERGGGSAAGSTAGGGAAYEEYYDDYDDFM